jgi:hypothetical protein
MNLVKGLEQKGHIVAMGPPDIGLLKNMECIGIYKTYIVQANRIGMHESITNTKQFGKN